MHIIPLLSVVFFHILFHFRIVRCRLLSFKSVYVPFSPIFLCFKMVDSVVHPSESLPCMSSTQLVQSVSSPRGTQITRVIYRTHTVPKWFVILIKTRRQSNGWITSRILLFPSSNYVIFSILMWCDIHDSLSSFYYYVLKNPRRSIIWLQLETSF